MHIAGVKGTRGYARLSVWAQAHNLLRCRHRSAARPSVRPFDCPPPLPHSYLACFSPSCGQLGNGPELKSAYKWVDQVWVCSQVPTSPYFWKFDMFSTVPHLALHVSTKKKTRQRKGRKEKRKGVKRSVSSDVSHTELIWAGCRFLWCLCWATGLCGLSDPCTSSSIRACHESLSFACSHSLSLNGLFAGQRMRWQGDSKWLTRSPWETGGEDASV